MGYEVQTSARVDVVNMNEAKKQTSLPITWVAESGKVLDEIKRPINGKDCMSWFEYQVRSYVLSKITYGICNTDTYKYFCIQNILCKEKIF